MIVVGDTSPLRALAYLQQLDLLERFFGEVLIPPAVERELQQASVRGTLDVSEFEWIQIVAPHNREQVDRLQMLPDPGESEALERLADAVLINETAGRAVATQLGLSATGTLGILMRAKNLGLIAALSPLLDQLEAGLGFFISADLRADVLRRVGE